MTDVPLVSVAMISYNHRPFIRQALDSVLNQNCDFEIEIIIGDDASPDGTGDIIREYTLKYPQRLRDISPPTNLGMHANFNRVWQACRGQYIAMLEGDDFWIDPAKLATQVAFMESHPNMTVSGHSVHWCDEQGTITGRFPEDTASIPPVTDATRLFHQGNYLQTCSVMFRRGVVPQVPEWISKLGYADYPLMLLHAFRGEVGFHDQPHATYRRHANSVWTPKSALFKQLQHYRMLCAMSRLPAGDVGTFGDTIRQTRDNSAEGLFDEAHWFRKAGQCDNAWQMYRELLRERVTPRVVMASLKNALAWLNPFRGRRVTP